MHHYAGCDNKTHLVPQAKMARLREDGTLQTHTSASTLVFKKKTGKVVAVQDRLFDGVSDVSYIPSPSFYRSEGDSPNEHPALTSI